MNEGEATFADLGIPFPLWEAPVKSASSYVGVQTCLLCQNTVQHCFRLGVGDDIVVTCPACQTENGLSADDKTSEPCRNCGQSVACPVALTDEKELRVCYACLRAGRAAITKDTVFGMIRWEDAIKGQTHGVPGLDRTDVETVDIDEGWKAARLAPETMFELLRTPNYITWQGERWQFDEGRPMIYVGEWNQEDFNRHAPDGDGKRLFYELVEEPLDEHWEFIADVLPAVYVFRSATRQKWAAHWDMD